MIDTYPDTMESPIVYRTRRPTLRKRGIICAVIYRKDIGKFENYLAHLRRQGYKFNETNWTMRNWQHQTMSINLSYTRPSEKKFVPAIVAFVKMTCPR